MATEAHQFRLGAFACIAVNDGEHVYAPPDFPPPAVFLFAGAPKEQLASTLAAHGLQSWPAWTSPYTCLFADTGEHKLLIDTGTGGLTPTTGRLRTVLAAEGIDAAAIDTVVLTHGHPDHIGGCTDEAGELLFPSARHVMWKAEHDFWMSDEAVRLLDEHVADLLVGIARKNLRGINAKLELLTEEAEVVPGVRMLAAPGHTPGHAALLIESAGEQLFYLADTVLHPIQLEQPHFCGVVDVVHGQLTETRRRLLERVAASGALAHAFHFPFPGLGHVEKKGDAWVWRPLA